MIFSILESWDHPQTLSGMYHNQVIRAWIILEKPLYPLM